MDDVEKIYEEGKLLVRAMDRPSLRIGNDGNYYECESWINEFDNLMNDGLFSLSTTLIVPKVGVRTYKNIGFLVNSDWVDCLHIAKSDSASSGNILDGDFSANKADFNSIDDLLNYIIQSKDTRMNEVNINAKLNAVVGLFINKCNISNELLKDIYVINKMIQYLVGVDYQIYLYDQLNGKIDLINLTKEQEENLISSLGGNEILCWPDSMMEAEFIPIKSNEMHK